MEFLNSIVSKIGDYLVDSAIRQVGYLYYFNNIVEDLNKEGENLRLAEDRVQRIVETARRNAEEIEKDVEKWLMDVSKVFENLHKFEAEIQVNKTCLSGWCPNWRWRYRLSREATDMKSIMLKLQGSGKFDKVSHRAPLPGIEFLAPENFMPFESTKFAIHQIIEALKDDRTNMVGLYAMGGMGKTTVAKAVRNKVKEQNIFNEVVMVVISHTPNIKSIQQQIAELLSLKLEEETEFGRANVLWLRLKSESKILLILDDVWGKLDLKTIGIPFGDDHKGCKIFLTTRQIQVCIAMGCQREIPLNALNYEEGLSLLKRHANLGDDHIILNNFAKEVARECQGLPLAIETIGSQLKGKGLDEWKVVTQRLKRSNDAVDRDVYARLKPSYDYLKDDEKLCFLLCSLFPKDYTIDLEELLRYGMGLNLFPDAESIEEDARTQLRVMVKELRASCLLLNDGKDECVQMHNVVRGVALWIASEGNKIFMVKAGMGLKEWPKKEDMEQYTAISLMANEIKVLPIGLVCPKLEILLLSPTNYWFKTTVPDEFFLKMKALKVLTVHRRHLSLKSLQFLTNLRTLHLEGCEFADMSFLKKLVELEILSFKGSYFGELPKELGELSKLRLLDLRSCSWLRRIPFNIIQRLSELEELYIDAKSFKEWEVEGRDERSNASLSELNSLPRLAVLQLDIKAEHLPEYFAFSKLKRYDINVNFHVYSSPNPVTRTLRIKDIRATSMVLFKALYETLEYLDLKSIKGCQNIVPKLDDMGLNKLKSLNLDGCNEVECVIDTRHKHLRAEIGKESLLALSSLAELQLGKLPELRCIWKGPSHHVSVRNLTSVVVSDCKSLTYLFPSSLARSLVQLELLKIIGCERLEHIVSKLGDDNEGNGNHIALPKLRELRLVRLANLISFCPENYDSAWPALQEFGLNDCFNLSTSFIAELEAKMQDSEEKLRVLEVGGCNQLCNTVVSLLRYGCLQSLEELRIYSCEGIHVVFELEDSLGGAKSDGQKRTLSLPNLKRLELEQLEELEVICKGSSPPYIILNLQKLTYLSVSHCHMLTHIFSPSLVPNLLQLKNLTIQNCGKLRHIFTPTLAQNLLQLEWLSIEDCSELEQIIVEEEGQTCVVPQQIIIEEDDDDDDEEEDDQTWLLKKDILQPPLPPPPIVLFPNLVRIEVKRCNKLIRVFPPDTIAARGLQKLKYLIVEEAIQLKEVFGHKEDEGDKKKKKKEDEDDKEVVLSGLKEMTLKALPSLINVCPVGYHFIFPALYHLEMKECPKITTMFSFDAQYESVHAETKASQVKEHVASKEKAEEDVTSQEKVEEDVTTKTEVQEDVPTRPSIHIDWWRKLRGKLPPYLEER